jgi:methyl halide transferase
LQQYFDQLQRKDLSILITGDFFDHHDQYDLIIEQTFFCALEPALRPAYVEQTARLLRSGGKLAGLLFDREFASPCPGTTGGPPFGGSRQEYRQLLEKNFAIKHLAPCYNSIKPRAGTEVFLIAQKHDS